MNRFLRSLSRTLFSSPLAPSRRRLRGCAGVDALEARVLLTVDLQSAGGTFSVVPTNVPNQYTFDFQLSLFNAGSTTADLSGDLFDPSDNVIIRGVMSTDGVYGNGDDTQVGLFLFISNSDHNKVTLAAQKSVVYHLEGTFTANPAFQFFLMKLDSSNVLPESNETNNVTVPASAAFFNVISFRTGTAVILAGTTHTLAPDAYAVAIDTTEFGNAKLTAKMTENKPGDQLGLVSGTFNGETLKRAGKNLKLGTEVIGTVSGGKKGQALAVQFQPTADNLLVNQVLKSITFKSKRSEPGVRFVDVAVDLPNGKQLFHEQGFNVTPSPKH